MSHNDEASSMDQQIMTPTTQGGTPLFQKYAGKTTA